MFISLLNQLHLLEPYALSIFVCNLKIEIGQYLQLFKPTSLLKGFQIAKQVERILLHSQKWTIFPTVGSQNQPFLAFSIMTRHSSTIGRSITSSHVPSIPSVSSSKPSSKGISPIVMAEQK